MASLAGSSTVAPKWAIAAAVVLGAQTVSANCWAKGNTPAACCNPVGGQDPRCWNTPNEYKKCCHDSREGKNFHELRLNFMEDLAQSGADLNFNIDSVREMNKLGRTGAISTSNMEPRETILRIPSTHVYDVTKVPTELWTMAKLKGCDAHVALSLGLVHEKRKAEYESSSSWLHSWFGLLPRAFTNLLWFEDEQTTLAKSTYFGYIVTAWENDMHCMAEISTETSRVEKFWFGNPPMLEDLRWALSVVKTRGFSTDNTRESTLLIPLADFLNHGWDANVHTDPLDALHFITKKPVKSNEELRIEYARASNLEFLMRYGFRVDGNPYGGRSFDLTGETLQGQCPPIDLRHDLREVVPHTVVDCHRKARWVAFKQQFGTITREETVKEDQHIYRAIADACENLGEMLPVGSVLDTDALLTVWLRDEIKREKNLTMSCTNEFRRRQFEREVMPFGEDIDAQAQAQKLLSKTLDTPSDVPSGSNAIDMAWKSMNAAHVPNSEL